MSETTAPRASGLAAMKLDELKVVAVSMGLTGIGRMRKSDLVEAIRARQSDGKAAPVTTPPQTAAPADGGPSTPAKRGAAPSQDAAPASQGLTSETSRPARQTEARAPRVARRASRAAGTTVAAEPSPQESAPAGGPGEEQAGRRGSVERPGDSSPAVPAADVSTAADIPASAEARSSSSDAPSSTTGDRSADISETGDSRDAGVAGDTAARGNEAERRNRQERQERALRAVRESAGARTANESETATHRGGEPASGDDDHVEGPTSSSRRERGDRTARAERTSRAERADQSRADQSRAEDLEGAAGDGGAQKPSTTRQHSAQATASHQTSQAGQAGHDDSSGQAARVADDDDRGSRRSRNRQRSRDRKRGRTGTGTSASEWADAEAAINDDDVLVPVGGILDVLDNYAFVRTSGYLPGDDDVYVPLGMVKKHSLRKGDAVTGVVKALREGEVPTGSVGRQKFNALVRLDSVNGAPAEETTKRVDFNSLTPLYPQERLRLETESGQLTTRIIDLIAPIGKGQRGLIVAPAKAGKTTMLQALATAITTNNPECHLMVVLVDERPEEVTEMQRAVKGEVIASTFDRPAEDHTTVAELAIERAKRLVELGHDVVVLLDSITKLGRAYNLSAPASGRVLPGGVDAAALYPPRRFFGAARNIEYGGSLTILATALVETGSKMDEVIFEEFTGAANFELHLSGDLASRRVFPAVDIAASGTRREEILLADEERKIMWKLRRALGTLDTQQAVELVIERLRKTRTNYELLTQVQATNSSRLHEG